MSSNVESAKQGGRQSRDCIEAARNNLNGIVEVLRFLALTRRYSIIDRLGFTLDPRVALEALEEALRVVHSSRTTALRIRGVKLVLKKSEEGAKYVEEGEETIVECCDYDVFENGCPPGYTPFGVVEVLSGRAPSGRICCVRCPRLPGDDEVKIAAECIYRLTRDFTRILVTRALAWG